LYIYLNISLTILPDTDYIISTERLSLRRWRQTDIDPFAKMNSDETVMKYFPAMLSKSETIAMIQRINIHFEKNNFGLYAVEEKKSGAFIGFTGFSIPSFEFFFTPCVEIGWRYQKEYWGQGFATEAAQACLQHGFNVLGFQQIFSFTSTLNLPSENVMKRIGMIKTGEFDHPKIDITNRICRHVLYRIDKRVTI
jgi:[ribosomal protein S5]-alanine N-acetyltransferase